LTKIIGSAALTAAAAAGGSLEALYDSGTLTTSSGDTYTPSSGALSFENYIGVLMVVEVSTSGSIRLDMVLDGDTTTETHYTVGGTLSAAGARSNFADTDAAYSSFSSTASTGTNKNMCCQMELFFNTATTSMLGYSYALNRDDIKSEFHLNDYYSILNTADIIESLGLVPSSGNFTGRWFVYGIKK